MGNERLTCLFRGKKSITVSFLPAVEHMPACFCFRAQTNPYRFEPAERLWHRIVFPAKRPSNREQVWLPCNPCHVVLYFVDVCFLRVAVLVQENVNCGPCWLFDFHLKPKHFPHGVHDRPAKVHRFSRCFPLGFPPENCRFRPDSTKCCSITTRIWLNLGGTRPMTKSART